MHRHWCRGAPARQNIDSREAAPVPGALRSIAAWLLVVGTLLRTEAQGQTVEDLSRLSIEQLGDVEITSVSKQPQRLGSAAAAIYVITHDEIMRSGATRIPDILRLAPNLFVAEVSPGQYVITTRGLSGNLGDQNFANKILVLIDGRAVYSPLFSGVYWDTVDVMPEDIERIEVISGPGGALWGANAVNGVINVITRKAAQTQGGLLDIGGGNLEYGAALQYGGTAGDDLAYRLYARDYEYRSQETETGADAHDSMNKPQGGFRLDWTPNSDAVTVEGDAYDGAEEVPGNPDLDVEGRDLEATWKHPFEDGSSLQVLSYYDESERTTAGGGAGFTLTNYDLEVQHDFQLGSWNNIVWGAGDRVSPYAITDNVTPITSLLFVPSSRTLNLADAFVQDQISLPEQLELTLGLKIEDDPYSGVSPMPTVRLAWTPTDGALLWTAVSRAIRSPTPFDVDVVEKLGTLTYLTGNPGFLPEELTAYEAGYRGQLFRQASFSLSGYYDVYDHLRSVEYPPDGGLPFEWGNLMEGHIYGLEAWGDYKPTDWWKLSAGLDLQREGLRFASGSSGLLGVAQAGDDPHHQAQLKSSMNLGSDVTFDTDLRCIGELPQPKVPQYIELNARLGWAITDRIELSLSGFNLLHPQHQEFMFPQSDLIKRSFFLETRWKF